MKTIFLLFSMLCISYTGFSQNYYQTDGALITAGDITFKVEKGYYVIYLGNVSNTKINRVPVYKDGRICEEPEAASVSSIPGGIARAFVETFTKAEFAELQKINRTGPMDISYVISPEGETIEVEFGILDIPELQRVPPSKFALLEKNLKKYVKWEVNDFGKQLQFLFGLSFANFPLMELHYPGDPIPEVGAGQIDPEIKDPNLPGLHE